MAWYDIKSKIDNGGTAYYVRFSPNGYGLWIIDQRENWKFPGIYLRLTWAGKDAWCFRVW